MEFVTPSPLEPGDEIAVVAPSRGAAATYDSVFELALDRLRVTFDLEPVVYPTAERDDEYLEDHPEARAEDVMDAFRNPDHRGVVATIGGDDQLRILKHLDSSVLRDNPTRFYGMSDNTNLALYLWNQGVVSFYGGQLLNEVATPGYLPDYTERYLRRAFFEESIGEIEPSQAWTDDPIDWGDPDYAETDPEYEDNDGWRWHGETAVEGRVWGGCAAIIRWQLMTERYLPDPERLDGAVLALETSETLPSADRLRWLLMTMGERGLLQRFDGVLVGRPRTRNRFEDPGEEGRTEYREDQREAILGQVERYNPDAPVVFDLDFGHTNPTVPIPIGGRVELDPGAERIAFD